MTNADALKLAPGDAVWTTINGKRVLAVVASVDKMPTALGVAAVVELRRTGRVHVAGRHRSRPYPSTWRAPSDLDKADAGAVPVANVYADFLDDHGHHDAAALLRERFPMPAASEVRP